MKQGLCLIATLWLLGCSAATTATGPAPSQRVQQNEIDTSNLTARERGDYNELLRSLLAPCPELPLSLAECIDRKAACDTCLPAAEFLHDSIGRGHTNAQAEAAFRIRFDSKSLHSINTAGSPAKGSADAPVVIVEWADFECPFCARASSTIEQLLKTRLQRVRVVFKYYPLSAHPHGELTAQAAAAADLQGKFWPMHDQLFAHQTSGLDEAKIREIAKSIGLNPEKFEADWVSDEIKSRVEQDRMEAERLGLRGTPFIWVNGRNVDLKYFNLEEDLPAWLDLEWSLSTKTRRKP